MKENYLYIKSQILLFSLIKSLIFFLSSFVTVVTFAQNPTKNSPPLSVSDYQQLILPHIEAMTEEFFTILKLLHPQTILINEYRQTLPSLTFSFEDWKNIPCHSSSAQPMNQSLNSDLCSKIISDLYSQFTRLDTLFLNLEHSARPSLAMLSPLGKLSQINFTLIRNLEKAKIDSTLSSLEPRKNKFSAGNFRECDELFRQYRIVFEQVIFQGVPSNLKDRLLTLWNDFFRVLNSPYPIPNRAYLFWSSLPNLNMSWHYFNMPFVKRHVVVPPMILSRLDTIQNHWNIILKIMSNKGILNS